MGRIISDLFSIFSSRVFAEWIPVPLGIPIDYSGDPSNKILWGGVIPGLLRLLLFLAFILAIIFLLWGGISWTMSGGSKEGLESARKKVTYAVIGLILVLISFAIFYIFGNLFGVNLKNP